MSAAAATHPLGPRLLRSIATDEAPYAAVPAKPAGIAHALRRLRNADLVYQPVLWRWCLADPALGEVMRGRERGRRSITDLAIAALNVLRRSSRKLEGKTVGEAAATAWPRSRSVRPARS